MEAETASTRKPDSRKSDSRKTNSRKTTKRDRAATEQSILDAFEAVMIRDGVKGLGVNAVANQAEVNKVLIYRYFGDFLGLANRWAEANMVWPSALELIGNNPEAFAKLPVRDRVRTVFGNYMEAVRQRPLVVELLAAELCFPSELTHVLESAVERPGRELDDYIEVRKSDPKIADKVSDLSTIVSAVAAFICIREKNNPQYLNQELNDESWQRLRQVMDELIDKYLAE